MSGSSWAISATICSQLSSLMSVAARSRTSSEACMALSSFAPGTRLGGRAGSSSGTARAASAGLAGRRTPSGALIVSRGSGGFMEALCTPPASSRCRRSGPQPELRRLRLGAEARVLNQAAGPGQVLRRGHELRLGVEQVELVGRDHALDILLRDPLLEDGLGED